MIFLAIGTQFPFDRLVRAVDDIFGQGLIDEEIFAQTGESSYKPRNFEAVSSLEYSVFAKYMREASSVISAAGIGTITMALDNKKPLLIMPRLKKYREVVNDHQLAIARKFEELGHVLVAYSTQEMPNKIKLLKTFKPRRRDNQAQMVAQRIDKFLKELNRASE